jgi:LemA protein
MWVIWVALGIVAVGLIIVFLLYNSLIAKKNQVDNAFASTDVMLKKRYDLIPNLVATVKQYMQHEANLLTEVTELRARALSPGLSSDQAVELNNQITQALGGIMVAVENYPELKASDNFMHLQRSLNEIEEQISAARRAYNAAVTSFNNAVEMVPTNLLANLMGYSRRQFFEIPQAERQSPDVGNLFKS